MTIHTTAAGLPLRVTGTLGPAPEITADRRLEVMQRIRDELERDEWPTTPATAENGGCDEDFSWLQPADTDQR
ncbi:hypothetical protein LZ318_30950 [Saccharopolyspora indica]|uniref:hypothetical protein n=1 Tax=Saccharopolyspora indica TaxID=1229659 RepID=UPI0022EAA476|nr:hypothetical protein [Saccharopolyspora indica]MDA3644348.1 hypothetical protein [Saccharopolyspora indica]